MSVSDHQGELVDHRFEQLVQAVTDYAIYMLDTEGRIVTWNAGAERFKGYSADDIIGQHFSRFFTPEDIAADLPARALETVAREGRFEAEDLRFHRRVREGYLEIARADKNRVVVLDADRAPDALHADVVRAVAELLARRGGPRGA